MTDRTFLQLRKACKSIDENLLGSKMVVMGDCATQHIVTAIQGYAYLENLNLKIIDTDYNLIDAQVFDDKSELYISDPEFVLIIMCCEKLAREFYKCADKAKFADDTFDKIQNYWSIISKRIKTNILQFTFVENDDKSFGNYSLKTEESFLFQVKKLNFLLAQGCQTNKNVFLIDFNSIQNQVGREKFYSAPLYYTSKIPVSLELLPEVAKQVVDVIKAIQGKIKKCIICDLDNTLWGGVIGDDGLCGIQIGELGLGHAFEDLQYWLKSLKDRGIILGVCSKNEEKAAKEPFLHHPEMVLKLDDFSIFIANWDDKASNIKYIQKTLNIGMDSIVFLDDNKFERELVRTVIPEVTVPELPNDPALYLEYLKGLNLFETASFSEGDKERTKQYQSEIKRASAEKQYASFDDYLKGLEMKATAAPFDEFNTPRIAQLTQRSNQFNLRTVRCTESDIALLSKNKQYINRYFTLKDKFGDHGLISVVIMKKTDSQTLFIENWLMSCRVLKRGMEEYIINTLVEIAKNEGFKTIIGEYIKTPKNAMVAQIYSKMGFETISNNRFQIKTDNYKLQKTFIK